MHEDSKHFSQNKFPSGNKNKLIINFLLVLGKNLLEYCHGISLRGDSYLFHRETIKASLIIFKDFPVDFKWVFNVINGPLEKLSKILYI